MWSMLVLSAALTSGQNPPTPDGPVATITAPQALTEVLKPAETPATPRAPAPAERWPLMQALQGTWCGWLLDDNRLKVSGWIEGSFTGSTVGRDNTPEGSNFHANNFSVNPDGRHGNPEH
jgi:hypothetical protein